MPCSELFALYPDKVFNVDELLERFFPDANSGNRVVRVYVNQLRQKISEDVIETVPGGYALGKNQAISRPEMLGQLPFKKRPKAE